MRMSVSLAALTLTLATATTALAQQPAGGATPAPPSQNPPTAQPPSAQQPATPSGAAPAQGTPQQSAPQQAAPQRQFNADAGLILNFIKPDKTADFEMVISKLKEALQKSDKPERKQQAAGWKVYKASEAGPNGSVIYVFMMDPAVKGVDYTVPMILNEVSPTEAQELYKAYAGAFASGQNIVNLSVLAAMGQP